MFLIVRMVYVKFKGKYMKLLVILSLLVSSVSYACPKECKQLARTKVMECLMKAEEHPGTEDEKAQIFQQCILEFQATPEFAKCEKLCRKP